MVCSGDGERVREFMAMGPERSKPLHNFTLPYLKWGNQKHLRCMKVDDASTTASTATAADHRQPNQRRRSPPSSRFEAPVDAGIRRREPESPGHKHSLRERRLRVSRPRNDGEAEGIEAVREKIMKDLKTAADKMKDAIFREEVSDEDDEEFGELEEKEKAKEKEKEKTKEKESGESPATEAEARPWNLRTRRAACKAPGGGGANSNNNNKGLRIEEKKVNNTVSYSPMRNEMVNSPRVRERERGGMVAGLAAQRKERVKFSLTLSKKEIEEDFMQMVGHRPARRPKKRPRVVQKQLDSLFPGSWLTEVTPDSYKVPEFADNGKR